MNFAIQSRKTVQNYPKIRRQTNGGSGCTIAPPEYATGAKIAGLGSRHEMIPLKFEFLG